MSVQYQADKWWEQRKILFGELQVDPIPNSPNLHHKRCLADSKENYWREPWIERVERTTVIGTGWLMFRQPERKSSSESSSCYLPHAPIRVYVQSGCKITSYFGVFFSIPTDRHCWPNWSGKVVIDIGFIPYSGESWWKNNHRWCWHRYPWAAGFTLAANHHPTGNSTV